MNPNLIDAYEQRAIHFYFQRRFDKAIKDYTRLIELKPDGVEAFRMRAMAFLKKAHG